jgi:hypothetical protein
VPFDFDAFFVPRLFVGDNLKDDGIGKSLRICIVRSSKSKCSRAHRGVAEEPVKGLMNPDSEHIAEFRHSVVQCSSKQYYYRSKLHVATYAEDD